MGIVSAALALTAVAATVPPNPIHDAAKYTTFVGNHSHGLHFRVTAPDALPFSVVHTYGTASQRGQAHGYLLSAQVIHMIEHQMQAFYEQYVRDINLGGLPDWLKKASRWARASRASRGSSTASSERRSETFSAAISSTPTGS